ncbi:MAG: tRNA-intron lyase [Candidatus Nanohaloarchaeota archaeon QJJ-7]|nr:tRNA-intron lyase [Candidatus Nanohaloarchaeota archaeon QJJ-7]
MVVKGELLENRVRIFEDWDEVFEDLYYGKEFEDYLELSLVEAMHLADRDEITVEDDDEELSPEELYERFTERDEEFPQKYAVYADLRDRGYIVKSGFKFGAHFRVYPRGVNPYKEGPKEQREHTQWVVHAVPQDENFTYTDVSRAVRLAQNIRATMLWGVVDPEEEVTYYRVEHVTP